MMKKFRILTGLILGLVVTMVFCSCSSQNDSASSQERFVEVSHDSRVRVFVDKETNVEWLYERSNGTFQVLIDRYGNPRVHE